MHVILCSSFWSIKYLDYCFYISDRMAEIMKEEIVLIKKEICPSSSLEEACTWDVQEEVKIENTEIKGKRSGQNREIKVN